MLLALLIGGVILWVLSLLFEGAEKAKRKRALDKRIAAQNARIEASWKKHDEEWPILMRELYEQERAGRFKL